MRGIKRGKFSEWWNTEGHRWLPQANESPQHAYVAEKAWDAACSMAAVRLRSVADVYEAGGHTHRAKMLLALANEFEPWPSGGGNGNMWTAEEVKIKACIHNPAAAGFGPCELCSAGEEIRKPSSYRKANS